MTNDTLPLLKPEECALIIVDQQAGLAFAVGSADRQTLRSNSVAIARTATAFGVPVVISTSATKVYSGPVISEVLAAVPEVKTIERRNMNLWEDDAVRAAVQATDRRTLLFSGLLTEACVSFPVLSALAAGYRVFVVADACGSLTCASHELALRRMESAGASLTSWLQVLLEFQRDWTRHDTYEAARSIVVDHGGGYGIGLAYAREMIHPY